MRVSEPDEELLLTFGMRSAGVCQYLRCSGIGLISRKGGYRIATPQ
jgi:hypothetical protein